MKSEETMLEKHSSNPFQSQVEILPASDANQTRFAMPTKSQPVGISVSLVAANRDTSHLSNWIQSAEGFSLLSRHNTASSALAALPKEKPAIVLMDIDPPDLSATGCLQRLKAILEQTQFVVLMADEDTDKIFNAFAAGASGYLLKQTPRDDLLATVKHIHAGGSPMNSSIAARVLNSFQHESLGDNAAELSPRENRLLRLLARGSSNREAATALNISLPMVSTYIRSIYDKLHLHATATFCNNTRTTPLAKAQYTIDPH
jgi:DNA-binding NarL/FixJ family response regulator